MKWYNACKEDSAMQLSNDEVNRFLRQRGLQIVCQERWQRLTAHINYRYMNNDARFTNHKSEILPLPPLHSILFSWFSYNSYVARLNGGGKKKKMDGTKKLHIHVFISICTNGKLILEKYFSLKYSPFLAQKFIFFFFLFYETKRLCNLKLKCF